MTYKWLSFGQNHQEYQRFTRWPKYIKLFLPADQSSLVAVVPKNAFLVLWTRFYQANRAKTRVLRRGHCTQKWYHWKHASCRWSNLSYAKRVFSLHWHFPGRGNRHRLSPLRRTLSVKVTYPYFIFGRLNAGDLNRKLIQIHRQTLRTDSRHYNSHQNGGCFVGHFHGSRW